MSSLHPTRAAQPGDTTGWGTFPGWEALHQRPRALGVPGSLQCLGGLRLCVGTAPGSRMQSWTNRQLPA